jgi:hypothetical protein
MDSNELVIPDFTEESAPLASLDEAPSFFERLGLENRTELSDLWDAISAEVEFFIENCTQTWEVEWPQLAAGERLASPTRKISVRAPKSWVKDDWQCAAEITVHIDKKSPRPVCAYLYIPQMKHSSASVAQTHCTILGEAAELMSALLNIDSLALLPTKSAAEEAGTEDDAFEENSDAC